MSDITLQVPNVGDFDEIEIIEIPIEVGQAIAKEDPLLVLESDKASMEIPSEAAGVVKAILVNVGDKVSEGRDIVVLAPSDEVAEPPAASAKTADAALPAEAPKPATAAQPAAAPQSNAVADVPRQGQESAPVDQSAVSTVDQASFVKAHASPSVRAFARELGVDLSQVKGSGRKDRITQEDVRGFVKAALKGGASAAAQGMGIPPIPEVDFSQFGEIRVEEMSRIQKLSGPHLHRSWLNVPMVTQHEDADVTELEDFRRSLKAEAEKAGVRVSSLAFIMKATAATLQAFPAFNSSLAPDGQHIIYKDYINIGIAVDTPNGLVVPVFKDIPNKSVYDISRELADVSSRAREAKLRGDELKGGTFSISSLGGIGGTAFTPLVNAPEVAILGLSRNQVKPVWNGSEFVPRTMLPMSLTYDHRVIDGANAARFVVHLSKLLGDLRRIML